MTQRQLDLSAEQVASLSDEHSPLTPRIVSKKPSHLKLKTSAKLTKKSAPPNYVKILCKQKQKGITYELILEVSYYIRTSDRYIIIS